MVRIGKPLTTRPQRYCDPASLVPFFLSASSHMVMTIRRLVGCVAESVRQRFSFLFPLSSQAVPHPFSISTSGILCPFSFLIIFIAP